HIRKQYHLLYTSQKHYITRVFSTGVGFATRQVGNLTKPTTLISVEGDVVTVKTQSHLWTEQDYLSSPLSNLFAAGCSFIFTVET
uniref:Uncharacterized protein n=1 Tax=Cyclopterus lumpus TaxID=8103 RepID=A0A8C3AFX2_CYCLU